MIIKDAIDNIKINENIIFRLNNTEEEARRIKELLNEYDQEFINSYLQTMTNLELKASFGVENYSDYLADYILEMIGRINPVIKLNTRIYNNDFQIKLNDILRLHKELMVFDESKVELGVIRRKKVYIGLPGSKPIFIPPTENLGKLMTELLDFFNKKGDNGKYHPILKSAIVHYLFIYIHPFMDGNGRTSRFIQNVAIWSDDRFRMESFYPLINLSRGFNKRKLEYFDIENTLSTNLLNNETWNRWFDFNLDLIDDHLYEMVINLEKTHKSYLARKQAEKILKKAK